jgi:hypothetical protein
MNVYLINASVLLVRKANLMKRIEAIERGGEDTADILTQFWTTSHSTPPPPLQPPPPLLLNVYQRIFTKCSSPYVVHLFAFKVKVLVGFFIFLHYSGEK